MAIKFGTDGWRAVIAEEYTFGNVRLCAQGTAELLIDQGFEDRGVVIGYDTRFGSGEFAAAVAEVTAANGVTTFLGDKPAPTPAVSYAVVSRGAGGGVVITASHNPPQWNGYKYKPDYGGSASPELVERLERNIAGAEAAQTVRRMELADAEASGAVKLVALEEGYKKQLASLVDIGAIRRAGLRVLVDSMYGTGSGYYTRLLSGGDTRVSQLRGGRNPAFPGMSQPEPLAHNLHGLISTIRRRRASVGLATDGDADRLGVVDETGRFITTLETFALLCMYQLEVLGRRGPLVRSLTMTSMVDRLGELYGVPVFVTPVGFKYLGPVMMREDALAAGEESGGYAFKGHIPERDGILSGLMVLDMMVKTGKSVSQLLADLHGKVGPHFYDRWDVNFPERDREQIAGRIDAAHPKKLGSHRVEDLETADGVRFVLDGGYWGLVRFSGTEPLLRLYAEAESPEEAQTILGELRGLAGV